jgi:hypothetical protein
MVFKFFFSLALVGCLVWLYIDHSTPSIIGACISALALAYNMFKKDPPKTYDEGNNFTINSGKGSINNQSAGNINQIIGRHDK